MSEDEIREAVVETLDALPGWVHQRMGEVVVIVEDTGPPTVSWASTTRSAACGGSSSTATRTTNVEQVRRTVLHEIGHHFGMDEDHLRELGYG